MRFWRICRRRYADGAASGEGARRYGGRWNSRGRRVVYASTSLALAAVEMFVPLEPNLRPDDLVAVEGEIPEGAEIAQVDIDGLPPRWRSDGEALRRLGDYWLDSRQSAALLVPSAAIVGDWNLLLNPAHPGFAAVRLQPAQPFTFDGRMYRGA